MSTVLPTCIASKLNEANQLLKTVLSIRQTNENVARRFFNKVLFFKFVNCFLVFFCQMPRVEGRGTGFNQQRQPASLQSFNRRHNSCVTQSTTVELDIFNDAISLSARTFLAFHQRVSIVT